MKWSVVLLTCTMLLGGCLGGGPEDDDAETSDSDPETEDTETEDDAEEPPPAVLPSTLYFTADGLTPDNPNSTEAERVLLDWDAWTDFFVTNAMPPRFATAPAEAPYLVTEMAATVYITTDGVATNDAQVVPEVPAWIGTTEGIVTSFFGSAPTRLMQGDVAEVDLEWSLPMGGLVVPSGESLVVDLATSYLKDPAAGDVFLLVGAESALSQVHLQAVPVDLPAVDSTEQVLSESGSLHGAECVAGETEGSRTSFQADVPDTTVEMRVELSRTGGTPAGDDMDVKTFDGAGTRVGGTSSPSGTETLRLYAPNFAAAAFGTWEFEVTSCAAQQVGFDLEVDVGLGAATTAVDEETIEETR